MVNGHINTSGRIIENGHDLIPKGMIIMWHPEQPTDKAPEGWAICDGDNGTPDLRGRFVRGVDPNGQNTKLGNTGGTEEVEYTIKNMPRHNHEISKGKYFEAQSKIYGNNNTDRGHVNLTESFSDKLQYTNAKKDGDGWHENRPPYYAIYYIMKL